MSIENMAIQTNQQEKNGRYKQVKISVDPAIASAFKDACALSNSSMAAVFTKFMADYINTTTGNIDGNPSSANRKSAPDYSTRRLRRKAIRRIIGQIEQIRDSEIGYRDRIPENFEGSIVYEKAEELVSLLEEVIELMAAY